MKNRSVTGTVPLIVGLVVTLFLSVGGCAPRQHATTGESDALWPRVLDDAPERTNKHVHWLEFGEVAPEPVAIHPEGHLVALQTHCETIVYDLRSGERLHAWLLPTTVVQFSRDGRRLLTKRIRGHENAATPPSACVG